MTPFVRFLSILLLNTVTFSFAHMEMKYPPPRRSLFNQYTGNNQHDYDITAPLTWKGKYPFPCRGFAPGKSVATLKPGQVINTEFTGPATHKGGHCQFALSYNDKDFVVIRTVLNECFTGREGLRMPVTLPPNAPGGKATFAWTWVNSEGNREYYMNCADVTIDAPAQGTLRGPELLVVNINGKETIGQMAHGADPRVDLFERRRIVEVGPGTPIRNEDQYGGNRGNTTRPGNGRNAQTPNNNGGGYQTGGSNPTGGQRYQAPPKCIPRPKRLRN
ncbi:hypothetical protein BKA69DRAFT_1174309 [Paraphysoderma sedebokerense]|nr:hypothetical protein BKA69DRAFT_1174309 [Paraphysoderma sedebokerense]